MPEVKIKTINRKTTIPKATIKRAAEIAYGLKPGTKKAEEKTKKQFSLRAK
jgi:hypothetical protein